MWLHDDIRRALPGYQVSEVRRRDEKNGSSWPRTGIERNKMPKPAEGESRDDYMARCMEQLVGEEGRTQAQAYAMCNAFWEERGKKE